MTNRLRMLGLGLALLLAGFASAEKKVAICHRPPGNPDNPQTISVSEDAVPAHLKHGDALGACPSGCLNDSSLCDDGNQCTSDTCLSSGLCQHTPVGCDDGNPCTIDLCDETSGCLSLPNDGAVCNDGSACTANDVCGGGQCAGTPIAGCCAIDAQCDDGNSCTADTCVGNTCKNSALDCSVADKCLAGFCSPATGQCGTTSVSCDDSNVCTDDSCDSTIGCVHVRTTSPPQSQETSCTDGADNDCDGFVDSDDSDCVVQCVSPAPGGPFGFADCDSQAANGCEANLNTDSNNCSGCNTMCPSAPNGTATCNAGSCGFTCNAGYTLCDFACFDLSNDVNHCGTCGNVCPSSPNATRTCTVGICGFK